MQPAAIVARPTIADPAAARATELLQESPGTPVRLASAGAAEVSNISPAELATVAPEATAEDKPLTPKPRASRTMPSRTSKADKADKQEHARAEFDEKRNVEALKPSRRSEKNLVGY